MGKPAPGPCPPGSLRPGVCSLGPPARPHSSEGRDTDPVQEARRGGASRCFLPPRQPTPPHLSPPLRGPLPSDQRPVWPPPWLGLRGSLRRSPVGGSQAAPWPPMANRSWAPQHRPAPDGTRRRKPSQCPGLSPLLCDLLLHPGLLPATGPVHPNTRPISCPFTASEEVGGPPHQRKHAGRGGVRGAGGALVMPALAQRVHMSGRTLPSHSPIS